MRIFSGWLACLLTVGLAACNEEVPTVDDGTACILDSECALSELCIEGTCRTNPDPDRCTQNADCDVSLICRDNACQGAPASGGCASDDDCATADRCTVADGDCLPSEACAHAEPGAPCDTTCFGNCVGRPACDDDGDCAVTEQCDGTLFVCLPIGDCGGDSDCPADASCLEGVCNDNGACVVDVDCPESQSCLDGACTRNDVCTTDVDCPSDQRCVEGLCLRRSDCVVDDDCAFDETCVDGTCNVIGACDDVDDCPDAPGIACLDGVCSRAPCGRDSECDDGLFCTGVETCNPRVGCAVGTPPSTSDLPSCATESCDEDSDLMVRVGRDELCGDGSPCTDDACDVDVGCVNPANSFVPPAGPADDCRLTICDGGVLKIVNNDVEVPSDQGAATDCQRAVCNNGARVLVVDDGETPVQGPTNDCRRQVCQNGLTAAVDDDGETPVQGPGSDCVREICSGGSATTTPDNAEVPLQGPTNDCKRQVCADGSVVEAANDVEVPPQGPLNDCTRQTCSSGTVVNVAAAETPPQRSTTDCTSQTCSNGSVVDVPAAETPAQRSSSDCTTQTCSNGAVVDVNANETLAQLSPTDCTTQSCVNGAPASVPNNSETPAQLSSTDCVSQICSAGAVTNASNNSEIPAQTSTTDCTTQTCSGGSVINTANNNETPAQVSPTDCKRQVCSGGGVVVQSNDTETTADVGCKDGICSGGQPALVQNNGNCSDTDVCTVGSCNVDGTCSQDPQDELCNCAAGQTGICRPDDARAPNSGSLAGCVCLTPTPFVCGVDDGDLDKQVLQRFELFAQGPSGNLGGAAGTTFVWDLAGTPAGADPSAQLLGNPTSRSTAFFQATTPSALSGGVAVRDWRLRVTIQEPDLPVRTCQFDVSTTKIPDTLEISLFMNDALDVDLHLISGAGASLFDFPFHELHDPAFGDDPNRDCHFANCSVCAISIPGQGCTAESPRIVDFDNPVDGAALTDKQDPQLDIDNQRGCFTGANGDLQCIPEKITVELPAAATFRVFPYLYGNALGGSGTLTTPSSTSVTIVIKCRDVTRTITRTLSSLAADGTAAATDDPLRYGDALFITVPATGACTLP
ncbi:MAG: hypothetical protein Q8O67_12605 [Deltaproteobacteria bacterium]|nr:hypothetical protein [Deltaproteobacteria bacterium]